MDLTERQKVKAPAGGAAPLAASEKASHYAYIDALRGIAFLGVLLVHSVDYLIYKHKFWPGLEPHVDRLAGDGRTGVQLFFVISALTLIMSSRSRRGYEKNATSNFFIRRFFRIAPLFWLSIIAYTWVGGAPFARQYWAPFGLDWRLILATVTFTHGWFPTSINSVVPGGWSVAVEMTFYVCVPLLFAWVTSLKRALAGTCVAVVLQVLINHLTISAFGPRWQGPNADLFYKFIGLWFPTQLPVFLLGFVLSFLVPSRHGVSPAQTPYRRVRSLSLLCLSMLFLFFATYKRPIPHIGDVFEFGLAFLFLTWGLSLMPWRLLVNKTICYIGLISYSCYLTHFMIVYVILPPLFFGLIRMMNLHLTSLSAVSLYFFLSLPLVMALSTLTYRFIEVPGIDLGRRIIARRESQRPRDAP